MDWDELLDPLSPLNENTMQEQMRIVNLQDGLIEAAKKLAAENYPTLSKARPAVKKAIDSVIIKHSINMSVDLSNVISGKAEEDDL
ncbi:hypothetical protein DVR12_13350 [Chitinophaga silvatica]|uniref:Uncharacterized protein n=1 Tax=Chitinophaga silvatica TaxID=2282649 RepID=A0A3E1YAR7_9BACT|nr:hypothetical protein [Chitinophaga silvatica]RFS22772.1 hypothetical protein DVR12_13350 [Chitinophaga silvatica]